MATRYDLFCFIFGMIIGLTLYGFFENMYALFWSGVVGIVFLAITIISEYDLLISEEVIKRGYN